MAVKPGCAPPCTVATPLPLPGLIPPWSGGLPTP